MHGRTGLLIGAAVLIGLGLVIARLLLRAFFAGRRGAPVAAEADDDSASIGKDDEPN